MEELTILHEDNHIIVVLKPQNVPTCEDESKDLDLLSMIKDYINAVIIGGGEPTLKLNDVS